MNVLAKLIQLVQIVKLLIHAGAIRATIVALVSGTTLHTRVSAVLIRLDQIVKRLIHA
jgi:hypothetical protein